MCHMHFEVVIFCTEMSNSALMCMEREKVNRVRRKMRVKIRIVPYVIPAASGQQVAPCGGLRGAVQVQRGRRM